MSLSSFINDNLINERLHINNSTKSATRTRPTSYKELRELVVTEIKKQGKDADLNFIDTSEITDMRGLFIVTNCRNIKIDQWDVSNVTSMENMFQNCKNFNCDLSKWDVSNVKYMLGMFYNCKSFNSDLSKWKVSQVENSYGFNRKCPGLTQDKMPNFK